MTKMTQEIFSKMYLEMKNAMQQVARQYKVDLEFDDTFYIWLDDHVEMLD